MDQGCATAVPLLPDTTTPRVKRVCPGEVQRSATRVTNVRDSATSGILCGDLKNSDIQTCHLGNNLRFCGGDARCRVWDQRKRVSSKWFTYFRAQTK